MNSAGQFLKTHSYFTVFLVITLFWAVVFLISGSWNSGYHFTDDHDIVAIHHALTAQGLSLFDTIRQWLEVDHATGRFRVFYFINRIFQTSLLGINFPAWSIFNAYLAILTTFFLFVLARLISFSILESLLFAGLTVIGAQSAIWWQLGPSETIGMFTLAIALLFAAIQVNSRWVNAVCQGLFVVYVILMSLSKEPFILMIPAVIFAKLWIDKTAKSIGWLQSLQRNRFSVGVLLIVFVAELLFVKYKVGTTPEIQYAGYEGLNLGKIWQASWSLLQEGNGLILLIALFFLLMLSCLKSADNQAEIYPADIRNIGYSDPIRIVRGFRRKSFSQSPFTIQPFTNHLGLLYLALLLTLIILPQAVIYAKSGISQRYLFPGILGLSFGITCIYRRLRQRAKPLVYVLLFLIVFSLILKLGLVLEKSRIFALEGRSTEALLTAIADNTEPNSQIVLVTNPYVYSEWTGSIKKYLEYVSKRPYLYLATYGKATVDPVLERKILDLYGARTLDRVTDPQKIQCVIVFPELQKQFLKRSVDWFIRQDYQEYIFGHFNRNLNPDSKIYLYCRH